MNHDQHVRDWRVGCYADWYGRLVHYPTIPTSGLVAWYEYVRDKAKVS